MVAEVPYVMVASPKAPISSFSELIAYAKAMLPTSLPNWKIKRPVARFLVAYNCLPMWMG
jgi:hypothetical protein